MLLKLHQRLSPVVLSENKRHHDNENSRPEIEWTPKIIHVETRNLNATGAGNADPEIEQRQAINYARDSSNITENGHYSKANVVSRNIHEPENSTDYGEAVSKNKKDDDDDENEDESDDDGGEDEEEEEEETEGDDEEENETEMERNTTEEKTELHDQGAGMEQERVEDTEKVMENLDGTSQNHVKLKEKIKTAEPTPVKSSDLKAGANLDERITGHLIKDETKTSDEEETEDLDEDTTREKSEEDSEALNDQIDDDLSNDNKKTKNQETDAVLNKIIENSDENTSENTPENPSYETDGDMEGEEGESKDRTLENEGSGYSAEETTRESALNVSEPDEVMTRDPAEETIETSEEELNKTSDIKTGKNKEIVGTSVDETTKNPGKELTEKTANEVYGSVKNQDLGQNSDQGTTKYLDNKNLKKVAVDNVDTSAKINGDLAAKSQISKGPLDIDEKMSELNREVSIKSAPESVSRAQTRSQIENIDVISSAGATDFDPVKKGQINVFIEKNEPFRDILQQTQNLRPHGNIYLNPLKSALPGERIILDFPQRGGERDDVNTSLILKPLEIDEPPSDVTQKNWRLHKNLMEQNQRRINWTQREDLRNGGERRNPPLKSFNEQMPTDQDEHRSDVTQNRQSLHSDLIKDRKPIDSVQKNDQRGREMNKRPTLNGIEIMKPTDQYEPIIDITQTPKGIHPDLITYRRFKDLKQRDYRRDRGKSRRLSFEHSEIKRPTGHHESSTDNTQSLRRLHSSLLGEQTPTDNQNGEADNWRSLIKSSKINSPSDHGELFSDVTRGPKNIYSNLPKDQRLEDDHNGGGEDRRSPIESTEMKTLTDQDRDTTHTFHNTYSNIPEDRSRAEDNSSLFKFSGIRNPTGQEKIHRNVNQNPLESYSDLTEDQRPKENQDGAREDSWSPIKSSITMSPTGEEEPFVDVTSQSHQSLYPNLQNDRRFGGIQYEGGYNNNFATQSSEFNKLTFPDEPSSGITQSTLSLYSDLPEEQKLEDEQSKGGQNKRTPLKSSVIMRPTDKSLWAGLTSESMAKRILGALEKSSKKPLISQNKIPQDKLTVETATAEKVPGNKVVILEEKDNWRGLIDGGAGRDPEEEEDRSNEGVTSEGEKSEVETEEGRGRLGLPQFPTPASVEEAETGSQEGKPGSEVTTDQDTKDIKEESPQENASTDVPVSTSTIIPLNVPSTAPSITNALATESGAETDEVDDLKLPPSPPRLETTEVSDAEPSGVDATKSSDSEVEIDEVDVDRTIPPLNLKPTTSSEDAPAHKRLPNFRVAPRKFNPLRAPQRILGASHVDLSRHAYLALLTAKIEARLVHICTTAIIAEEWTLTCAHCFFLDGELLAINRLMIVSGQTTTDVNNLSPSATISVAKEIHIHPMYQEKSFESITHDLGLVKVRRPFEFNDYCRKISIRALPLPYVTDPDTDMLVPLLTQSFGWELESSQLSVMNVTLRRGDVDTCPCIYWRHSRSLFCTYRKGGESICKGDYGGPLVYRQQLIGVAQGIRSHRCNKAYILEDDDCADNTKYAMYINTCLFLDWMGRHVPGLPHQPEECYFSRSGLLTAQCALVGLSVGAAVLLTSYVCRV